MGVQWGEMGENNLGVCFDFLVFLIIWVLDINPVGPGKKKTKAINWSFNNQLMALITN